MGFLRPAADSGHLYAWGMAAKRAAVAAEIFDFAVASQAVIAAPLKCTKPFVLTMPRHTWASAADY
jgi:hypothetical protein